ncbi:hypothetical protein HDIA_2836 [Hartmannibacter diazotrophicus]|uniref:Lysophospholipase n=1 Tax=Hartmannibacter diazotrophicus TaxID=1482074 RepID=A0A2C9D7T8_9HYPH|nr:DUF1489 domain-containing protein [Hartmannibacter diazotrophicus]SON56377.1 hypothetical protein HDIA_2836 [Hartmannibacter diazotrophicus]
MTIHLIKLCVGAESVEDLQSWIDERMAVRRRDGRPIEQIHTTRMFPKRVSEILDGGSLYWVIKGLVLVRQPIADLRPVKGEDGISRCEIVLEPVLTRTAPQPRRPFQGWRYLTPKDAPRDIGLVGVDDGMPEDMRRALGELGLI